MASAVSLEDAYLDARYACGALRIVAKRAGRLEEAKMLGEGITLLCAELRRLLAREGRDKVSRPFPSELLGESLDYLAKECLEASRRLQAAAGSRAAEILASAAGRLLGRE